MSLSFSLSVGGYGVRQNVVAKKRRRNQNVEIDELGELLPYRRTDGKALDKLSILRLTTSFFKLQNFVGVVYGGNGASNESVLTDLVDEAMDGFLMVIDSDGVILHTSDNMESFVALSPRDVIGHSLHDLVQSEQDSDTIRNNLQPKGNKPSQYRMFCLELKNPAPPKSQSFGQKMLLKLSGHLKVAVSRCPSQDQSSPTPSPKNQSSVEEAKPLVLGLVAECRPMAASLAIVEMDIPNLSFTCKIHLDWRMHTVDIKLRDVLGIEPADFMGLTYKSYLHPGDVERLKEAHDFLERTGFGCSPPFRMMSGSGDWVWSQTQTILRYNKKTQKPDHYELLFKIIGRPEGLIRYIEQKQVAGQPLQGSMATEPTQYSPQANFHWFYHGSVTDENSPAPSPASSVFSNGTVLSISPSPPSSVGLPSNPQPQAAQPSPPSAHITDQPLEIENLSVPPPPPPAQQQQQQQQQHYQQQQQQQQQHCQQQQHYQQQQQAPPPPSQEWVERERQLQEQIQRQRKLLQDLEQQQLLHQMQIPGQLQIGEVQQMLQEPVQSHVFAPSPSSSGYNGSLSSHTPSPLSMANSGPVPSPLELSSVHSGSLSSLAPSPLSVANSGPAPSPLSYSRTTAPQPPQTTTDQPQMTTGGQNGPNGATGNATNISFLGSVDYLTGSPDSALPLSPDIQELLQQFM